MAGRSRKSIPQALEAFSFSLPFGEKEALISQLAIPAGAPEDARVIRLEHGHPRYGEEITERNLVQETGQLHAVHLNKGCYLGQEIVERVRSLAKIHKVLRSLEINTDQPPAPGTKTDQGEVISSAYSPETGKSVAMAYVRTQFADPGTEFLIGDATARVR